MSDAQNGGQTIIGFTEAELGFFLVALGVVLWAASGTAQEATPPRVQPVVVTGGDVAVLERANVSPDSLAALQRRLAAVQREVDSLRSPILPTCASKRIVAGPIATVDAIGGGMLRVGGDTLAIAAFDARTAAARAQARRAGCAHQVRLRIRRDLPSLESEGVRLAINRLGLRIVRGAWVAE